MVTSASFVFREMEIRRKQNSGLRRLSRRRYKHVKNKRRCLWSCWIKYQSIKKYGENDENYQLDATIMIYYHK